MLNMFSEDELKTIISGEDDYDIVDLIGCMTVEGFSLHSTTILYFYQIISEFDIK